MTTSHSKTVFYQRRQIQWDLKGKLCSLWTIKVLSTFIKWVTQNTLVSRYYFVHTVSCSPVGFFLSCDGGKNTVRMYQAVPSMNKMNLWNPCWQFWSPLFMILATPQPVLASTEPPVQISQPSAGWKIIEEGQAYPGQGLHRHFFESSPDHLAVSPLWFLTHNPISHLRTPFSFQAMLPRFPLGAGWLLAAGVLREHFNIM